MKRLSLVLLSSLALGGVAFAEDMQKSEAVKGPPNAAGAQKSGAGTSDMSDKTGSQGQGASNAKESGEAEGKKPK